jgi:hypothetical protein
VIAVSAGDAHDGKIFGYRAFVRYAHDVFAGRRLTGLLWPLREDAFRRMWGGRPPQ